MQIHSRFHGLKPGSHRKIVKDYRSKTGKDQEILSESPISKQFLEDFTQIPSKCHGLYLSLACNLLQSFCVNRALTYIILSEACSLLEYFLCEAGLLLLEGCDQLISVISVPFCHDF